MLIFPLWKHASLLEECAVFKQHREHSYIFCFGLFKWIYCHWWSHLETLLFVEIFLITKVREILQKNPKWFVTLIKMVHFAHVVNSYLSGFPFEQWLQKCSSYLREAEEAVPVSYWYGLRLDVAHPPPGICFQRAEYQCSISCSVSVTLGWVNSW